MKHQIPTIHKFYHKEEPAIEYMYVVQLTRYNTPYIIEELWFYVLHGLLTCLEFESKNEGQLGMGD